MAKEIFININDDNDEGNSKDRIITYNVHCQVSDSKVTIVDETGKTLKIICPYTSRIGDYMGCQLRKKFGESRPCGIYDGMKS